jgi:hypothetical protein
MDKWTFIITVIISILCGIVANLGTPTIRRFLTKGFLGYRKARLNEYRSTLETILSFQKNPVVFIMFLLKDILTTGAYFLFSILLLGWAYSSDITILKKVWFIPIGAALGTLNSGLSFARGVLTAGYTERLSAKIKSLEDEFASKEQIEEGGKTT